MIKPCIQQHFHQLHKSSKFHQLPDADSQTETPSIEHVSLSLLVTEQMTVVSSEHWDWTLMIQVVTQNASAEMMILIPEMTCEMVNQSMILHKQTACFSAFLFIVKHIHSVNKNKFSNTGVINVTKLKNFKTLCWKSSDKHRYT